MSATLYLIFHGPWGFTITPNLASPIAIAAATPYIDTHAYRVQLAGATSAQWPRAGFTATPGTVGLLAGAGGLKPLGTPDPLNAACPQAYLPAPTTVPMKPAASAGSAFWIVGVPATVMYGRQLMQRVHTSGKADSILSGASYGDLEPLTPGGIAYIALNQVLAYTVDDSVSVTLNGGEIIAPVAASVGGVLLCHIYGQEPPSGPLPKSGTNEDFRAMAALYGLDLTLDSKTAKIVDVDAAGRQLAPAAVATSALADLSGTMPGVVNPMVPKIPTLCGGGLLVNGNN